MIHIPLDRKILPEPISASKTVAVILSGCGSLDGTNVFECVLAVLAAQQLGIRCKFFSVDKQIAAINHKTGTPGGSQRNSLEESTRIIMGRVENIATLRSENFDGAILPGGMGAIKNLANLSETGTSTVDLDVERALISLWRERKPIFGICIAPLVIVASLRSCAVTEVTIGADSENRVAACGGRGINVKDGEAGFVFDEVNKVYSTPAFMDSTADSVSIYGSITTMLQHAFS